MQLTTVQNYDNRKEGFLPFRHSVKSFHFIIIIILDEP